MNFSSRRPPPPPQNFIIVRPPASAEAVEAAIEQSFRREAVDARHVKVEVIYHTAVD